MNEKQTVALSSTFASAAMTIGKFMVGLSTGSLGLISEGLHSLLDFGATLLTFFAVQVSDKPADAEHLYGHGKIESIAALAETLLLFLTSIWIVWEAAHRLLAGKIEVEATWWSVAVIVVSIVIDISRARALKRVAEKTRSQALEADALHFSSDVLSSLVVLVGLGFVALGWPQGDPIAAIGVSIFVCHAGWRLGRRTVDTLIDTAPRGAVEHISALVRAVEGVKGVERVRIRPAGSTFFVDLDVSVGRSLSLVQVASMRDNIVTTIREQMPEAEVTVSTHPLALDDETIHQRLMIIAANHNVSIHHITAHRSDGQLLVGFDLEVDGHSSISDAHEIASSLEIAVRDEFGAETEVETHIEPLHARGIDGRLVEQEEQDKIREILERLASESGKLSGMHNVRVRESYMGLIVCFQCRTAADLTVAEVHEIVDSLEHKVRQAYPGIWRIVAHAEPQETKELFGSAP
jgi:cation diffusion facilitator family transporter